MVRRRVPACAGPRVSIRPCRCGPVHPQLALAGEGARARGRRARRRGGGAHAPVEEERDRVGRHACCIWCGSVGSQVEIEEERAGGGKGAKSERRTSESQRALRNPANVDRGSPGPPFSSRRALTSKYRHARRDEPRSARGAVGSEREQVEKVKAAQHESPKRSAIEDGAGRAELDGDCTSRTGRKDSEPVDARRRAPSSEVEPPPPRPGASTSPSSRLPSLLLHRAHPPHRPSSCPTPCR